MVELAGSIDEMTTTLVDVSDILRASLVLAVSAFDYFVHELVRLGMLEIQRGVRNETDSFLSFKVSISSVREAFLDLSRYDWLNQAVREAHSFQTFQQPDKIARAIRLISNAKLWEEVSQRIGMTNKSVQAQLSAIVDRRNRIAHEADVDPLMPGQRWSIDEGLVLGAIAFLEGVAGAIFDSV